MLFNMHVSIITNVTRPCTNCITLSHALHLEYVDCTPNDIFQTSLCGVEIGILQAPE